MLLQSSFWRNLIPQVLHAKPMLSRFWRAFDTEPSSEGIDSKRLLAMCLEDPEQAKRLLKREHRRLAEELEKTMVAYQERLEDVSRKLRGSSQDPAKLEEEVMMLLREQREIERVVQRIALAEQETQQLLGEWQDWARHVQEGVQLDERSRLRMELLRSELTAREVKIRMPDVKASSRSAPMADKMRERVAIEPKVFADWESPSALLRANDLGEDHLEDWEAVTGRTEMSREELKRAFAELLPQLAMMDAKEAVVAVRRMGLS